MQVRVLFFGVLKDLVGRASESLNLPDNATLADVLRHYESRVPRLKDMLDSLALAVNQEYAEPDVPLQSGDEVALLPPVSGGSDEPPNKPQAPRVRIIREKIETDAILARMKHPEDGAAVVFEGVVRNHSRGRHTLYLDYEGYEPMALKQMEALAAQALGQFKVREVAIIHRLGRLEIGETSVLVIVASAHRGPAFEACRWLIDTLKRTVPIWKKEYFEDGAVWADGEPFPGELGIKAGSRAGEGASK